MRTASGVTYLHGDHLGSTSLTRSASGTIARQTYYPFGLVRTTDGLPTDYTFTGQKLDSSSGLMYYGARCYAADLGRFAQPDSIVPDPYNPQSLNRYAYALNNPVKHTDPSGHCVQIDDDPDGLCVRTDDEGNLTQIVHGGSMFSRGTEVPLANALLSGNEDLLVAITNQMASPLFNWTHKYVSSLLGYSDSASESTDTSAGMAMGVGFAAAEMKMKSGDDESGVPKIIKGAEKDKIYRGSSSGQTRIINGHKVRVDWEGLRTNEDTLQREVHVTVDKEKFSISSPADLDRLGIDKSIRNDPWVRRQVENALRNVDNLLKR